MPSSPVKIQNYRDRDREEWRIDFDRPEEAEKIANIIDKIKKEPIRKTPFSEEGRGVIVAVISGLILIFLTWFFGFN